MTMSRAHKQRSDNQSKEMSKSQGGGLPRNLQQQQSKQGLSGQLQSIISDGLMKNLTVLDEFKYGFPSKGLSVASNKWWGSGSPGNLDCINAPEIGEAKKNNCERMVNDDGSNSETKPEEKENCDVTLQGTSLLKAVRKRALEEGQEALKLYSHRVHKIGRKEKSLMLNIFQSSLPKGWIDD